MSFSLLSNFVSFCKEELFVLCNTLICLQLATHGVSSCGTHGVVTHSQKTRFSAHRTSCCWPNSSQAVKKVSKDSVQDHARTSAYVKQRLHVSPSQQCLEDILFWMEQHELSLHNKVITNHTTGTPILHAEASFNSAERGLRRGISS